MIGQLPNHLLQSTLFALATALLVLAFRKNRARVRYLLWLTASVKFLIPFSVLIALGSHINWTPAAHEIVTRAASRNVVQTVEQLSEPFTVAIPASPRQTDRKPFAIAAIWFCGLACITFLRLRAWQGMRIAVLRSQPIDLGLPVEARLSPGICEPGVVGLWRPILLLPQGIVERLTPSELEAIIAHELCHIRRRDNLFAAIHMLIEALFWFHPLVWWIGARMLNERERACDEDVVSRGNQSPIYADAILNVCKLYTESPLACVSGVTGSNVRRRLEAIMSNQKVTGLSLAKRTLLACAAIVALAGPLTIGLLIGIGQAPHLIAQSRPASSAQQTAPHASTSSAPLQIAQAEQSLKFEAATVKPTSGDLPDGRVVVGMLPSVGGPGTNDPGRIRYPAISLKVLLLQAFDVRGVPGIRGPDWLADDFFEVNATMAVDTTPEQFRVMLRNLLSERFGLVVHRETKPASGYTLTLAKNGPAMMEAEGDMPPRDEKWVPKVDKDGFVTPRGGQELFVQTGRLRSRFTYQHAPMKMLTGTLEMILGKPVTDGTGLTKNYDFTLTFRTAGTTSESGPGLGQPSWVDQGLKARPTDAAIVEATPDIFDAVRALGLKLEPKTTPEDTLVIDHIEKSPIAN